MTTTDVRVPDKLYFKIGEVSKIVSVKPYVLRYWESEFKFIRPQKSKSKQRLYRKRDVELLLEIKHLLYDERYTIAGARVKLKELFQLKRKLSDDMPMDEMDFEPIEELPQEKIKIPIPIDRFRLIGDIRSGLEELIAMASN